MHGEVTKFCLEIKETYPEYFIGSEVLDVGSININGTNKGLFENCNYIGIDLIKGDNVDVVTPCHLMTGKYDVIISTEAFEHDMYFEKSIKNIMQMLKPFGLFLFTCATTGRQEHGTINKLPGDSATTQIDGWENYYRNVTKNDVEKIILPFMDDYEFRKVNTDLQFYGFKKS